MTHDLSDLFLVSPNPLQEAIVSGQSREISPPTWAPQPAMTKQNDVQSSRTTNDPVNQMTGLFRFESTIIPCNPQLDSITESLVFLVLLST